MKKLVYLSNCTTFYKFILLAGILINSINLKASCSANYTYSVNDSLRKVTFTNHSSAGNTIIYAWDFGDGNYSNLTNPIHQYSNSGFYRVCLTLFSYPDSCTNSYCDTIWIKGNTSCQASFNYFIDTTASNIINFFGSNSKGSSLSYIWNFGDGSPIDYSSGQIVKHNYNKTGYYKVCLTVASSNSPCENMICDSLFVLKLSKECKADIQYFHTSKNFLHRTFSAQNSAGNNLQYTWDFDDGSPKETLNYSMNWHDFPKTGIYHVCLTVQSKTDSTCKNTKCVSVNLDTTYCNAHFSYIVDTLDGGGGRKFIPDIASQQYYYYWNFGDGQPSRLVDPYHYFTVAGQYTVCLTIANSVDSCTDTYCDTLYINQNTGFNSNITKSFLFELYPNPAVGIINIRLQTSEASLYEFHIKNILGETMDMFSKKINKGETINPINIEFYPNGIYFLEIHNSQGVSVKRFNK